MPERVRRHAVQALGALAPRQAEVQQVVVDHRQQIAARTVTQHVRQTRHRASTLLPSQHVAMLVQRAAQQVRVDHRQEVVANAGQQSLLGDAPERAVERNIKQHTHAVMSSAVVPRAS